jgi:mandelamide amidase
MSSNIAFTITDIATAIAEGTTTAEAVAEDVLERCQAFAHLGAIITQDPDALIASARAADQRRRDNDTLGPLHGVPLLIKDNIDTCDLPTSAGTPALEHDTPAHNAPVVQRLVDAGALIAGKANLYELAVGGGSFNTHFGAVKNPWNTQCIPGGSSSGSSAAVAARMVPGALGTDTNGSVRGPCSLSGIAGFRPSIQRYPYGGVLPSSPTRDAVGIMANSIADLALLDQVLAHQHSNDPRDLPEPLPPVSLRGLRLGRPRGEFYRVMDDAVAKVIDAAVAEMQAAGAIIVDIDLPEIVKLTAQTAWTITAYECPREAPGYLAHRGTSISMDDIVAGIASPIVRERFHSNTGDLEALETAYRQAMDEYRPQLQRILHAYFTDHDVAAMVYPTTPFPAPALPNDTANDIADVVINGKRVKGGFSAVINNTVHQSAAGIPSLVVPAGLTDDGLPVGLSFDGPLGSDRRLLAIGRAFEKVRGEFPLPENCGGNLINGVS